MCGRDEHSRKGKSTRLKIKVGVGPARMKSVMKELRKRYGPMLKRLAR